MNLPSFPRGRTVAPGGGMKGTIGALNPAEAGPLLAPYIPLRKQSHSKTMLNPGGGLDDIRIEKAFTDWGGTGVGGFDVVQSGFSHDQGDTLLDYSVPAKPAALEAGNYELMLWADYDTSAAGSQVGKMVYLQLQVVQVFPYAAIGLNQVAFMPGLTSGYAQPATCSLATYLDVGDYFEVNITEDGNPVIKGDQLFVWAKKIGAAPA